MASEAGFDFREFDRRRSVERRQRRDRGDPEPRPKPTKRNGTVSHAGSQGFHKRFGGRRGPGIGRRTCSSAPGHVEPAGFSSRRRIRYYFDRFGNGRRDPVNDGHLDRVSGVWRPESTRGPAGGGRQQRQRKNGAAPCTFRALERRLTQQAYVRRRIRIARRMRIRRPRRSLARMEIRSLSGRV